MNTTVYIEAVTDLLPDVFAKRDVLMELGFSMSDMDFFKRNGFSYGNGIFLFLTNYMHLILIYY